MLSNEERLQLKDATNDKELKKIFKIIASKNPDNYFPTQELRQLGYMRKHCDCCGNYFWTMLKERTVCGEPVCSGGFQVTTNNPAKVKLSFVGVWQKFVEILEPRGYLPIKRYPCVARWNPTSEFTIASISAFQPYVITGEVEPPAKKIIIPQFCLRFNDIENVGLTGSHNTGFVMIGQHVFVQPEEWNQGELFLDIHAFIHEGIGLPKEEITIHEDSWAGGGSFGCSLEFFSRGVELFNQVYTMFEQTPEGPQELKLKVLDMGLGQERVTWFSQGTPNMYEAIFPYVLTKLKDLTKIKIDFDLYDEFSRYSAYLNMDEVDDMDAAWDRVSAELKMDKKDLQEKVMPMTAIYSIADHTRTLLFAINDGKLPSNVGGGYNLRVILRRAISFIDKFGWELDLSEVCRWHAEELKDLFPEVSERLDDVKKILIVEKEKYYATKKKASKILEKLFTKGDISTETLIEIYDSRGINPEMVKETAKKFGRTVRIPDNFYSLVVERHEKKEQLDTAQEETKIDFNGDLETKSLYYNDYTKTTNKAKVLKIVDNKVILDQSVAYPTSGGQLHDIGTINGQKFNNVIKQGNYIIHILSEKPKFKEGDVVKVEVDKEWRTQLSQHHTATHIVNAAARSILGAHVNQAGAKKTVKHSTLDITHYKQITRKDLLKIENKANEIVKKAIEMKLSFLPRTEAEQKYGMTIYQGGAVPGKNIRIVEIPGVDVEACGGTHLNNTSEAGRIKLIKSQKIQDGIVRLTFTAGSATKELEVEDSLILSQLESLLEVSQSKIVGRVEELLDKWKNLNKAIQTGKFNESDMVLKSTKMVEVELLTELSRILNTKKEDIPKKVKKLFKEWNDAKTKLKNVGNLLSDEYVSDLIKKAVLYKDVKLLINSFEDITLKDLQNLSKRVHKKEEPIITLFVDKNKKGIEVLGMASKDIFNKLNLNIGNLVKEVVEHFEGKGGGRADYGQGLVDKKETSSLNVITKLKEKLNI
ncbi:MAG: alanine--tRNA ligase [Candidatus Lokiarchaeota archaeon]|nr:alanine--tRNA ligase [Candidatus Lokiarchaeota archaeon]